MRVELSEALKNVPRTKSVAEVESDVAQLKHEDQQKPSACDRFSACKEAKIHLH